MKISTYSLVRIDEVGGLDVVLEPQGVCVLETDDLDP